MHPNNKTPYKTLDRIAADPRVVKVYEDNDGIWADLADGYNFEGCSALRGDSVKRVMDDFGRIEEGAPY